MAIDLDDVTGLCAAYLPVLRDGDVFSRLTAAVIWGFPLPSDAPHEGIHVTAPSPRRAVEGRGTIGHRAVLTTGDRRTVGALPVVAPVVAWSQVAPMLRLEDAVAAADYLVTPVFGTSRSLATPDELSAEVDRRTGHRGHRSLFRALSQVRVGPYSRTESLTRLLCMSAGIPEPVLNPCGDGEFSDLTWPQFRVALEYEGDYHRGREQYRRDVRRLERLIDAGWLVMRVTADDIFDRPRELVERLARRLASRGWTGRLEVSQMVRVFR